MKLFSFIFTFFVIVSIAAPSHSQQDVNIIDNLEILAIKSIQIKDSSTMDTQVVINNKNDKKLRFKNATFNFHFSYEVSKDNPIVGSIKSCDTDKSSYQPVIEPKSYRKKLIGTTDCSRGEIVIDPGENIVLFHVGLGGHSNSPSKSESLIHIMNCIGYPNIKEPIIYIEGGFELGAYSSKGWTSVQSVQIEWIFKPDVQDKVNLFESAN